MRFLLAALVCASLLPGGYVRTVDAQVVVTFPQPKKLITNQDVVRMARAKFSDATIIKAIHANYPKFDLSPTALVALKTAGVSEPVIAEMLSADSDPVAAPVTIARPQPPTAPVAPVAPVAPAAPIPSPIPAIAVPTLAVSTPAASPEGIDEIGVYYKKDGKWIQMLPEVVNWKSGGVLKNNLTIGLIKGDLNGHIERASAKIKLSAPTDFLVYVPEGEAITEYQLLRLRVSGNSREFRSVTGGIFHVSGGARRDDVEFDGKKISTRMYEIHLGTDFRTGEYGFLPPGGVTSANVASSGKLYTFRILE